MRNYNLMQLANVNIPSSVKLNIIQMLQKLKIPVFSGHRFILLSTKQQLQSQFGDIQKFLQSFRYLTGFANKFNSTLT